MSKITVIINNHIEYDVSVFRSKYFRFNKNIDILEKYGNVNNPNTIICYNKNTNYSPMYISAYFCKTKSKSQLHVLSKNDITYIHKNKIRQYLINEIIN